MNSRPTEVAYYLGRPVEVLEDRGGGWTAARWPDGKVCIHWREQLKAEPWGEPIR